MVTESSATESIHPALRRRRGRVLKVLAAAAALTVVVAVDYWAYPYGAGPPGRPQNRGESGLWLRYTWYFGQHSAADISVLAGRLRDNGIRYAYFHVRGVSRSGSLKYRYPDRARTLVSAVHRLAPGTKAIAWVYAGNPAGSGAVNLEDLAVRGRMVSEATWLVRECGFDGVQWDYEICPDGDPGLVALLKETRASLPRTALLSVAAPVSMPWPLGRWGWQPEYIAQVAAHCDQLAVMCYDTGFVLPRAYVWLTARQVAVDTKSVRRGNPACRVLIGVPTYGPGFRSHNPKAENIEMALRGVRAGISDPRSDRSVLAGVAIFADYTTDESEWRTYQRLWLAAKR